MEKLKNYTISLALSFLVAVVLLSLTACIFAYTSINDRYLQTFVFACVMLSVLVGSTMLSKKIKEKGLLMGAIFGILYVLIVYLFTSLAYTGFFISNTLGIYLAVAVLSGVIGGVIGVNI